MSLAVEFRPEDWESVCGQKTIIETLKRQIELNKLCGAYLFCGPSGVGKTTLARIFSHCVNAYVDDNGRWCTSEPFEIDAASNNGVDNIRAINDSAKERSISGKYKIFILDECHMLSAQSFNSLLKTIEETPKYTIFILCTTEPQKIPATILNRVMRFNMTKISSSDIEKRLLYICNSKGYKNYQESCKYISKLANGGMRDAISMLERCAGYSDDLSINNVLECLGNFSYDVMFKIVNSVIDGDEKTTIESLDEIYNSGSDMKQFINKYTEFILELAEYCIFNDNSVITIPSVYEEKLKYTTEIDNGDAYFVKIANYLLDLSREIKTDTMYKTTITINFINMCRGV